MMRVHKRPILATLAVLCAAQGTTGCAGRFVAPAVEQGYIRTADGVRLFYRKVGSGRPAVVIPGDLFLFDDFRRLAGAGRTIVFYDMRNRGRSDAVRDSTTLTIRQDVEDLETVRRHFGFDRVQLIGYSYLGLMVVMHAMAYPERVERIVQLAPVARKWDTEYPEHLTERGPVPGVDTARARRMRELAQSGYRESHPKEFCELAWSVSRYGLVGDPARADRLGGSRCDMPNEWPVNFARHLRHHFTSVQQTTVTREEVARVRAPVLTIHGTRDRNASYGGGRQWALELPNARLLTVPGAAHQVWVDALDVVLGAVDTFLRGHWPAGAERVTVLDPRTASP
ncbi:MAG: alpha/beta fold hydrolase [Gemmatimonadaceae bacterium]